MKIKLAEPWWDQYKNPITGFKIRHEDQKIKQSKQDSTSYEIINYLNSKNVQ